MLQPQYINSTVRDGQLRKETNGLHKRLAAAAVSVSVLDTVQ